MAWNLGLLGAAGAGGAGGYDLLQSTVLTSPTSSVSFTGLDTYSDYKHLQIRYAARSTLTSSTEDYPRLQANSDTGTNYSQHRLRTNSSSVSSSGAANNSDIFVGEIDTNNIGNTSSPGLIDILDFSSSAKFPIFRIAQGNSSTPRLGISTGSYFGSSSLTSVQIFLNSNAFDTGSCFSIYGVKG